MDLHVTALQDSDGGRLSRGVRLDRSRIRRGAALGVRSRGSDGACAGQLWRGRIRVSSAPTVGRLRSSGAPARPPTRVAALPDCIELRSAGECAGGQVSGLTFKRHPLSWETPLSLSW
jgi:hypothetical protein